MLSLASSAGVVRAAERWLCRFVCLRGLHLFRGNDADVIFNYNGMSNMLWNKIRRSAAIPAKRRGCCCMDIIKCCVPAIACLVSFFSAFAGNFGQDAGGYGIYGSKGSREENRQPVFPFYAEKDGIGVCADFESASVGRVEIAIDTAGIVDSIFGIAIFDIPGLGCEYAGSSGSACFCGGAEPCDAVSGCKPSKTVFMDVYARPDPLNPVDTALVPSARWFYFKMTGVKDSRTVFVFHGTDPAKPFYSYDGKTYRRFSDVSKIIKRGAGDSDSVFVNSQYFEEDTVYVSYFVPYTVERLMGKIEEWKKSGFVEAVSIGKTTGGLDMPLLVITDTASRPDGCGLEYVVGGLRGSCLNGRHQSQGSKKKVYIHARTHTSETPCSWHLEGMIDMLVDKNNPYSAALRSETVFYILPFANPDGVACGLSRSGIHGVNQEINFDRPDSLTVQEVLNIKNFISESCSDAPFSLALNMHSQSSDFATFWVHDQESTSGAYFWKLMKIACMTASENPFLSPDDLCCSPLASRYIEGWLWNEFGEACTAITFETPYTYYGRKPADSVSCAILLSDGPSCSGNECNDRRAEWVSEENLAEFAGYSLSAIGDFLGISSCGRLNMITENCKGRMLRIKVKGLDPGTRACVYGWKRTGGTGWDCIGEYKASRKGVIRIKTANVYDIVQARICR